MKQFKSADDLLQLSQDDPTYPIVADLVKRLIVDYEADGWNYDPDADGWIVLWEESDGNRPVPEIWDDQTRLTDLIWEGFAKQDGAFQGVYLADNQKGFCVVIPDEPWVHPELLSYIHKHLDPPFTESTIA